MKQKTEFLTIGVSVLIGFFLILTPSMCDATSQVPPPIYGVEVAEHESSLTQIAGTTEAYELKVKNIGVIELGEIKLGVERLNPDWFSSDETVSLKFEETAILTYDLEIPEDAEGLYAFSIVVFGTSGINTVSSSHIVSLNVVKSDTVPIGGTTPTETTQMPTTQPPTTTPSTHTPVIYPTPSTTSTISKNQTVIETNFTSLVEGFNEISNYILSKFKSAVTRTRIFVGRVLTDMNILLSATIGLFAVLLILIVVRYIIS